MAADPTPNSAALPPCYLSRGRHVHATFGPAVVVIYMPMVPEAIVSMLACARLGAIHNVVFGGFAAKQLAARIEDSTPKVIISASCGLEPGRVVEYKPLLDEAIALSPHKPDRCVILQRGEAEATMDPLRDVDWAVANAAAVPHPPVPVLAEDPLYVIYTSGTTGQPKAIQRENGGHAVALNWSMPAIYGCDTGDTWWAASDVGWVRACHHIFYHGPFSLPFLFKTTRFTLQMLPLCPDARSKVVGSSYICYGPLLRGCTTVLYEGKPVGTPDAGEFWRVISQNRVKSMFAAPTAIRAIKAADSNGEFLQDLDMTSLKALFLAGERSDPATIEWAQELLGIPVIDHWWQTETGFPITSNYMGYDGPFPIKPGSSTFPVPGWDVTVLNEKTGELAGRNELGQLAVKLPLPPCAFTTLFRDEERFETSYLTDYPGYYNTGDAGHIDDDGYVSIMTRTDDIINVAGHRLSTGGMEQVLAQHPAVAECAVIGISDEIKGLIPLGLVVLKQTAIDDDQDQISRELIAMVRAQIGPVAAFKHALCVQVLPKVKSGKILRKTMKAIFDNREYAFPGNIEDPAVLTYIEEVATHFAKSQP